MSQFTKISLQITFGIFAVTLLSGCKAVKVALSPHYGRIGIDAVQQTNITPVAGADRIAPRVDVRDVRVGKIIGDSPSYDDAGDRDLFIATNDVGLVLKKSIEGALSKRGFKLSDQGITILVGLNSFFSRGKVLGAWAVLRGNNESIGSITLSVQIKKANGTIVYSQFVRGTGINPNSHCDEATATKDALENALANCLAQLFADPPFVQGLLEAGGDSQSGVKSATTS